MCARGHDRVRARAHARGCGRGHDRVRVHDRGRGKVRARGHGPDDHRSIFCQTSYPSLARPLA